MKRTLLAIAIASVGTMAHAASYNIESSFSGMLTGVQAMGPTTFGTGTFQNPNNPGVAGPNVVVNGLPGVSFAQIGSGSASYDGGLLNNLNGGYLEWTFTTAQNGWGGTFAMAAGNAGLSFTANDLKLGWIDVTTVLANQALDGFLGFTSTDQFSGVRVAALAPVGNGPVGTSYRMTDVSVAVAAPVPEPETYALMLGGLASVALATRRRKMKA